MIEISSEKSGLVSKIQIKGKFIIDEVPRFETEYMKLIGLNVSVIGVDLTETEYIDSSAVGALVKFMNTAKNSKIEIHLYNMNQSIRHIFKLAFIDRFFNITDAETLSKMYPEIKW